MISWLNRTRCRSGLRPFDMQVLLRYVKCWNVILLFQFCSYQCLKFHDLVNDEVQYFPILMHKPRLKQILEKPYRFFFSDFIFLFFFKRKKKLFVDMKSYFNFRWLGFIGSSIKQLFGQAPTVLWWWDPSESLFLYFGCYDTCYITSLWKWKVHGKGGAEGFICLILAQSVGELGMVLTLLV